MAIESNLKDMTINTVRGTKDLFGEDLNYHKSVIDAASNIASLHCYKELQPPILEYSEVFSRNLGEDSDVVSKEMYTVSDCGENDITLRPEFTASIARAIFSNGLQQTMPQKLFSYGPVFRRERPQKGRFRQFHQINFESIGADSIHADVEMILMSVRLLDDFLGLLGRYKIELNSLGCMDSRRSYRKALVEYFSRYKSDLSEDSLVRLEKNPLRILDTKDENEKKLVRDAPLMRSHFTDSAKKRWDDLCSILEKLNIKYEENDKLVRGLDYYTHTVFEFTTQDLGAQGTILAGGRYDGLYSNFANVEIPAIGFAAGIERIAQIMKDHNILSYKSKQCAILPMGERAELFCYQVSERLRDTKINCYIDYNGKISKRLRKADQNKVEYAIIIGDNEVESGEVKVKDLSSGSEKDLSLSELESFFGPLLL